MAINAASDAFLLDLYACCADAGRWTSVLDRLCGEVGSLSAVVQCIELDGARAVPYWAAYDSRIDMAAYRSEVSDAGNPRFESWRLRRVAARPGCIATDRELFLPGETAIRDRLHAQLRRAGLGGFMGAMAPLGGNRYAALVLHRDPRDEVDFSPRHKQRLRRLMPHLLQAAGLAQAAAASRCASTLVEHYLGAWPRALALSDGRGRVWWANRQARALDHRSVVSLRGQEFSAPPPAQAALADALSRASQAGEPVFLKLSGLHGAMQLALQGLDGRGASGEGLVLVSFVDETQQHGHFPIAALRALFGLTEAEARLASALVAGKTVEAYARDRGVTVGTARYQLNQVLGKVGARRQADLVRRVLCSAAALVVPGPD